MSKKTIMLVCAAGMSTSLLVAKMQKYAKAKGLDIEIFSVPVGEAYASVKSKNVDVALLGPQIRFKKEELSAKFTPKGIVVDVINMQDYGTMNAENVLNSALKLIKDK